MPVQNRVTQADFGRRDHDRHRGSGKHPPRRLITWIVNRDRDGSHTGLTERTGAARERVERGPSRGHVERPQKDDGRFSSQRGERTRGTGEVPQRKVRRRERLVHPRRRRRRRRRTRDRRRRVPRRSPSQGLRPDVTPLDDPNAAVQRHVRERLRAAGGPFDGQLHDALARAEADDQLLRMLRQEPGPGLHDLRAAHPIGLDDHAGADGVAIALRASEPHLERSRVRRLEIVPEHAKLRCLSGRHHDEVLVAVAVDVERREGSSVLIEIESERARDLVEASVSVVAQEHVPLMAGDRSVNQQLIHRAPGIVIRRAGRARERRTGDHLPPEESLEVFAGSRQHPVDDVEILPTVVIEIERIRAPRPAAQLGMRRERPVFEPAVSEIPEKRIPSRVPPVERAHVRRRIGHERRRRRHAPAGRAPHVAGVDVEPSVVVVVEEGRAHPGAVIEDARRSGDVLEHDPAIPEPEITVEILGPEVVRDQKVRPAVAVVVGPGGREVIAIVAGVETGPRRHIDEPPVAVVAKENARRAIARVVVRCWRSRLVFSGAEEIRVDADVQIEEAVAVVVRHRDRRQHPLQRPGELKCVGNAREVSLAIVDEEKKLRRGGQHEVFVAIVVDVGEERLRGVVEDSNSRGVGDVLERAVAAIAVEAVGQPRRLGDVQIVEPVAIRIPDRHAVMAVRVARQDRIERRHPGVEIDAELTPERVVAAERRLRDLGEDAASRAADHVRRRGPSDDPPSGCVPPLDRLGAS